MKYGKLLLFYHMTLCISVGRCLSICLWHLCIVCIQMAKYIVKLLSWPGSRKIRGSWGRLLSSSKGNPLSGGIKYTCGGKNCNFWLKPFMLEMVRDRQMVAMSQFFQRDLLGIPEHGWEGSSPVCHRKYKHYGFLTGNFQSACDIVESLESNLFRSVCASPQHVLFRLLPPVKVTSYNWRQRSHHLTFPQIGNNFIRNNFLYSMLFKDSY